MEKQQGIYLYLHNFKIVIYVEYCSASSGDEQYEHTATVYSFIMFSFLSEQQQQQKHIKLNSFHI